MNQQTEGFMQRMRGTLRSAWGDLTDDDLDRVGGDIDQLVGLIKEKTGEGEEEIRERLEGLEREEGEGRRMAS